MPLIKANTRLMRIRNTAFVLGFTCVVFVILGSYLFGCNLHFLAKQQYDGPYANSTFTNSPGYNSAMYNFGWNSTFQIAAAHLSTYGIIWDYLGSDTPTRSRNKFTRLPAICTLLFTLVCVFVLVSLSVYQEAPDKVTSTLNFVSNSFSLAAAAALAWKLRMKARKRLGLPESVRGTLVEWTENMSTLFANMLMDLTLLRESRSNSGVYIPNCYIRKSSPAVIR